MRHPRAEGVALFAPSFFTGSLIARFGVRRILGAGGFILLISAATAISGQTLAHFLVALVALGVGWNFLFIGGSTMLTLSGCAAAPMPGWRAPDRAQTGCSARQPCGSTSTGSPAAFHSGMPSSSRRTLNPRLRNAATASNESTQ